MRSQGTLWSPLPSAHESRIGASAGESFFTCRWQFMQVCVGGTPACGPRSTYAWQYRQSIFRSPACSLWLYGTGCFGPYPTSVFQGDAHQYTEKMMTGTTINDPYVM